MNTLFLFQYDSGMPQIYDAPLTYLLTAIIAFTSYRYMDDLGEKERFMFYPYAIARRPKEEWYRFFSLGLVHGDWLHLIFNGMVLLMFGSELEMTFVRPEYFGAWGRLVYLALIITGLPMASLYSYYKHKDNAYYRALGASGTISGLVFAFILIHPLAGMGLLFIPNVFIPAFIFGLLYLAFSAYMDKRGGDNIAHDAHYWGSVWGIVFLAIIRPTTVPDFFMAIRTYLVSFF